MAQDLKLSSETGIIVEVVQKNPRQYEGRLIDIETKETVYFLANRPVSKDEMVSYQRTGPKVIKIEQQHLDTVLGLIR